MAQMTVASDQSRFDDPDYSTEPVPASARLPRESVAMAWWALCSALFWLVLPATLALKFGTINAMSALLVVAIVFGILTGIISRFAIRTGLSIILFAQCVFGRIGGLIATAIYAITAIFYTVFEGSVVGLAIAAYFSSLELWLAYLIVVITAVPLVLGGISLWLDKFNGYLLPFFLAGLAAAVISAIMQHDANMDWLTAAPQGSRPFDHGWWSCLAYYLGAAVVMMFTWDWGRFGRIEDISRLSKVTFGIPFYLFSYVVMGLVGIFLANTVPTQQELSEKTIVFVLIELMGFAGLIFVWISQTRINSANMQAAVVNIQGIAKIVSGRSVPKFWTALLVGAVVFGVMLTDVFSILLQALAYQSVFIVAWLAVAITYVVTSTDQDNANLLQMAKDKSMPLAMVSPLLAWLLGSAVGLCLLLGSAEWSAAAPLASAITAMGIFAGLRKVTALRSARLAA
jgi:cytosine permease